MVSLADARRDDERMDERSCVRKSTVKRTATANGSNNKRIAGTLKGRDCFCMLRTMGGYAVSGPRRLPLNEAERWNVDKSAGP